jgi:hypothetical protein
MKTTAASATTTLPVAVMRYLAAANGSDALTAADCFTADALVRDENRDYLGRDAIRAWVAETSGKYHPTFTIMRAATRGDDVSLALAVAGQFPGSPVTLDYALRICAGKISKLTIE